MKFTQTPNSPTQAVTRVLAFDPGFERLGVALVVKEQGREAVLFSDCLRTPATLPFDERLYQLGAQAELLIEQWAPDAVALEEIYFENNAKTAMKVAEVRGMLAYIARSYSLPLFHYTPLEVKVAITGYGKSDKAAVTMMVNRLVTLPPRKCLDDELDAVAVGLTCLASARTNLR